MTKRFFPTPPDSYGHQTCHHQALRLRRLRRLFRPPVPPHRPHERQAQGGQDEAAERGQAAGAPAAAEGVSPGYDGGGGGMKFKFFVKFGIVDSLEI